LNDKINEGEIDVVCRLSRKGKMNNSYRIFVGKSEWRRQLARPKRKWEDSISTDITTSSCRCIDVEMYAGFIWLWISVTFHEVGGG
jgi:hypothetical protein